MSKITKRKHVVREVLDDFVVPTEKQEIVKVLAGRGNNLHEVINSDGHTFLVSMPSKFRKNVWIKRGDFVIVEPIEEGDKVQGEIVHILLQEHIRHIKSEGLWPEAFGVVHQNSDMYVEDDLLPPSDSEEDDDLGLKVVNANRPQPVYHESSDDDDDDDDEDEENRGECDDSEKDKNGNGDKKCTEKLECAHPEHDSR